jgi:hypothetical protein
MFRKIISLPVVLALALIGCNTEYSVIVRANTTGGQPYLL